LRGFERNEMKGAKLPGNDRWVDGGELTAQLIQTLEGVQDRPALLWVHYLDSHDPYYKSGLKGGSTFKHYLRSLRVVDGYLGQVRAAIERLGLKERALIVALADHGEAFGEHDSRFHGSSLYDELIHVPLVMAGAGAVPRTIDVPVSLVDLGPTILDWFGLDTPSSFMGESLVPFLLGESRSFQRPIVAETRLKQAMVFDDGFKAIRDLRRQTVELYDLNRDPGELENLSDRVDPEREEHLLLLRSFFQVHTYREDGYRVPYVK
jgi:arylsulfatase A-like enzyme